MFDFIKKTNKRNIITVSIVGLILIILTFVVKEKIATFVVGPIITPISRETINKETTLPGGIYGMVQKDKDISKVYSSITEKSLNSITGFSIWRTWGQLEPGEDQYQWGNLTDQIKKAVDIYGKNNIILRIGSGRNSPPWIYSKGSTKFIYMDRDFITGKYEEAEEPLPWDPIYLNHFTEFIEKLSEELDGLDAKYYNAIKIIAIGGGGHTGGPEVMHPIGSDPETVIDLRNNSAQGFYGPAAHNYNAEWVAVGYTSIKLFNAWKTIIDSWASAFPDKYLAQYTAPRAVFGEEKGDTTMYQVVDYAVKKLGNRLALQNAFLSAKEPKRDDFDKIIDYYRVNDGVLVGFQFIIQSASEIFGGALKQGIINGLNRGAQYLELFPGDIIDYPDDIKFSNDYWFGSDQTSPTPITNFMAATGINSGEINLVWAAPEDDLISEGSVGAVKGYLVKYSLNSITTETDFESSTTYPQSWIPARVGMQENFVLSGLEAGNNYFIAIKAVDDAGKYSNFASSSAVAANKAASYLPKGVYALVSTDKPVDDEILINPNISGLQIRASWAQLEPTNNNFDWVYFDNLISQAKTNNKKVSIAVARGIESAKQNLPPWLSSSVFSCSDGTQGPIPWDPAYRSEWIEIWTAIAKRYENEPTVSMYHIGGIYSWHTVDWDLCDATKIDRDNWISAGYEIEKIRDFALEFTAALSQVTKKPFILPIAGTMDNNGNINTGTNTNELIIKPLFDRYGPSATTPQFGIMRTVFSENTPDPLGIWNTKLLGDQFGTIYNWTPHIAGQRDMVDNDSLEAIKKMFDISLHYNIQFMELGNSQILFPGIENDLACYNSKLGATDAHCGGHSGVISPADLNKDGKVDQLDFNIFQLDFDKTTKPPADINQDGIVDTRDLGIFMSEYTG